MCIRDRLDERGLPRAVFPDDGELFARRQGEVDLSLIHISSCPFGAISDTSQIVHVIERIRGEGEVYAVLAPAVEGQFGMATFAQIEMCIRDRDRPLAALLQEAVGAVLAYVGDSAKI